MGCAGYNLPGEGLIGKLPAGGGAQQHRAYLANICSNKAVRRKVTTDAVHLAVLHASRDPEMPGHLEHSCSKGLPFET